MNKRVAIIGGGAGGLASGLRLAQAGATVHLFEKNESLGGKMNQITLDGFRFDTGPSLITMPFVIDDLFAACGENRADYFEFQPVDPICKYFFHDGAEFNAFADPDALKFQISKLSPRDVGNYVEFLSYSKALYDLTARVFLFSAIHEPSQTLRRENLGLLFKLPKLDAFRTVHKAVSRFFRDPRLVQLFDRYATYNGSDPFKAPATLNIIPYVEYGLGGYYVSGGIYKLIESLHALAENVGMHIHTSTPVEKILYEGNRVTGLQVDGKAVPLDAVVCNADVVEAHRTLIDGFEHRRGVLETFEPSLSGMVFFWGVKGKTSELEHHNILFSADYKREFKQLFDDLQPPDDPTVYVSITSKSDAEHAPADSENWFVLLNMPYLNGQDWDEAVMQMRQRVLGKLRRHQIDLHGRILTERVFTPEDFYRLWGGNRGSIYGISSNDRNMAFKRPPNRSRQLQGLYFAGGSSHPGGGVPLCLLSGKLAADLVIERELEN